MSAAWVGGTVRARALLRRRIGDDLARELAAAPGPDAAGVRLAKSSYERFLPEDRDPAAVERAIDEGTLWNLRVLAGWLPRAGATAVRILVADFEIRNIADKLRALSGLPHAAPYRLGALSTAWRQASSAASAAELGQVLSASPWGAVSSDDPGELVADLRLAASCRLAALHEVARPWGAGAAALAVARRRFLIDRRLSGPSTSRVRPLLGTAASEAEGWTAYVNALPPAIAGWALDGIENPQGLWRAEERWWKRVEHDAAALAHGSGFGLEPALGCAVLLLTDARAVRRALAASGRGGHDPGADDDRA